MKAEHHMRHQIWAFLQHLYSFPLLWKLPKSHQRPLILQRELRINFRRTAGYCFNTALPNRITAWMSRCTWSFGCYTIELTLTDCQMEEKSTHRFVWVCRRTDFPGRHTILGHTTWSALYEITFRVQPALCVLFFSLSVSFPCQFFLFLTVLCSRLLHLC